MDARRSKAPRKKTGAPRENPYPLPVPIGPHAGSCYWPVYTGHLSGNRVYVNDHDAVIRLYRMGYFGKGTLSKHAPTFHRDRKAELFDLRQHLQKVTHKVFLSRTFLGPLASGCSGPTRLVSAVSLACQQPFTPDHSATVTSPPDAPELAAAVRLDDSEVGGCADSSVPVAVGRPIAASAPLACDNDGAASVSTPSCSVPAVANAAADDWSDTAAARAAAWDSMEPDVDFWLAGPEQASSSRVESSTVTGDSCLPSADTIHVPDLLAVHDSVKDSICPSSLDDALQFARQCDDPARDVLPSMQAERICEPVTMETDPPTLERGGNLCTETPYAGLTSDAGPPISQEEPSLAADDSAEVPLLTVDTAESKELTAAEAEPEKKKEKQVVLCENLELLMEEAFFLSFGLGCLRIVSNECCDAADQSRCAPDGSAEEDHADAHKRDCADRLDLSSRQSLDLRRMWSVMCERDPRFLPRYVAYHYMRSKGWVPRDGMRFGVDFVVYKTGPPFYHASYSVIVLTCDGASLAPADSFPVGRAWTWASLAGVNRVTENVNKELLMCYVVLPDDWNVEQLFQTPDCIRHCRVHFVHMLRLISSKEREAEKYACGSP